MKNQLLFIGFILLIGFACQTKESDLPATPLSSQNLEFEIYDSLVVDYLGNLTLMDISPDGKSYLLVDQNTDSIFVADATGSILHQYKRTGEGPENITGNRSGVAKFIDNETYLIPSSQGIYQYSVQGELLRKYNPDFTGMSQLLIPSNETHFVKGSKVFMSLLGRYGDLGQQGLTLQQKSKQVEVLDLESGNFQSFTPFPQASKLSSATEEYGQLELYSNLALLGDTLFINFRTEPKLFGYSLTNLDTPASVKTIPFPTFLEKNPSEKTISGQFNFRDFFYGTINKMIPMPDGLFLINYLSGLTDDDANQIISDAGTDFDKMFQLAGEKNEGGLVLFDGKDISPIIEKSEHLGYINKFISRDEIWFSLNFSKSEKDYSVIYKTRLVQK
jgi:hypothetical protein